MSVATDLYRARQAGVQAAREGAPRMGCPYSPEAGAPARERVLFLVWMSGYDTVNPAPIDYSG